MYKANLHLIKLVILSLKKANDLQMCCIFSVRKKKVAIMLLLKGFLITNVYQLFNKHNLGEIK